MVKYQSYKCEALDGIIWKIWIRGYVTYENLIEFGYRKGRREKFREKEGIKELASLCSNQYVSNNQYLVMDVCRKLLICIGM